ncbi:histidine phosphatase family protein [Allorhizobium sp. BGMRC 0089]|uniref:histidine phosphatase family protein n=1 Tax=Allorhizobium sonneratiae TaxID=2934936 RepID=UPI0020336B6D|nr:histidine phosphatase family protein [Allorhizobium sonneratiae]MCM2293494.1 histidine phosphatase family protein [Allorhizobium sonneratiae]
MAETALTLYIIRHSEKPGESWPGPGLNADGVEDKHSLVIRGWQRAGAWAAFFINGGAGQIPQTVYAAKPATVDNPKESSRPYETALPFSERLGLAGPDDRFAKGEEAALVTDLLGLSGAVLVSWEHKAIVDAIIPQLPLKSGISPPTTWPGDRYDVVLQFDRKAGDSSFSYQMLCPCLLSGDSATPF